MEINVTKTTFLKWFLISNKTINDKLLNDVLKICLQIKMSSFTSNATLSFPIIVIYENKCYKNNLLKWFLIWNESFNDKISNDVLNIRLKIKTFSFTSDATLSFPI